MVKTVCMWGQIIITPSTMSPPPPPPYYHHLHHHTTITSTTMPAPHPPPDHHHIFETLVAGMSHTTVHSDYCYSALVYAAIPLEVHYTLMHTHNSHIPLEFTTVIQYKHIRNAHSWNVYEVSTTLNVLRYT